MSSEDTLLTAKDAAQLLGVSVTEFNRRVKSGYIVPVPTIKARDRRYSKTSLLEYMSNWKAIHNTVKDNYKKDDAASGSAAAPS